MRILPWYILRLHLVPFLVGLGAVTFILEIDVLYEYLDLLITRGVPASAVLQLFGLSLGFLLGMMVPCAVLIAELMTFGRLSQDNEITALRASGVHMFRVMVPSLLAATVIAIGLVFFNNYVYPETNHAFANLMVDIHRMRPTVQLQEGVFITDLPGYNLLVKSVNGHTNEMHGVTIYQMNAGGPPTTIIAKSGFLSYTPDGRTAVIELKDGEIHEIQSEAGQPRRYHRLSFRRHSIFIQGAGGMLERTARESRGDREKSARALLDERAQVDAQYRQSLDQRLERFRAQGAHELDARVGLAPESAPIGARLASLGRSLARRPQPLDTLMAKYPELRIESDLWKMERQALRQRSASLSIEVHKKFALPAACIVFVLIGAPIGMRVKRGGPAVAFVSVAFFLFYYACLVVGEDYAKALVLPPWFAMWMANIVLGLLGLDLTARACDVRLPWHRAPKRLRGVPANPEPRSEAAA